MALLRSTYRNWFEIISRSIVRKSLPKAVLRDGTEIGLATKPASLSTALKYYHRWYDPSIYNLIGLGRLLAHGWRIEGFDEDHMLLSNKASTVVRCRLNRGTDISLLSEIFIRKVYGDNFGGKIVLDVGAYNGDSSIHFAREGASLVIGLEPDPQNYELAVENLRLNKLEDRVKLFNLALSTTPGESLLAVSTATPNVSRLDQKSAQDAETLNVATTSVKEIIEYLRYLGQRRIDVLKLNCEGCEYGIISNMSSEILESMDEIILEFHNGPRNMPKILSNHGFRTRIEGGTFGYIRARKIITSLDRSGTSLEVEYGRQNDIVVS